MELTDDLAVKTNILEGVSATVHKSLYPPKIAFDIPCAVNVLKSNAVREG
jgi:hypothetical protein